MARAERYKPMTSSYLLTNVPEDFWRQVKAKAALEGESVRAVILRLLREYLK